MKQSHFKFAFIASATLFMTGCLEKKEEVYDVEFYKTHQKEREEMFKKCGNNPGELSETPNCQNVFAAKRQLSSGKKRKINW